MTLIISFEKGMFGGSCKAGWIKRYGLLTASLMNEANINGKEKIM